MIKVLTNGFPYKPKKGCFGYSTCVLIKQNILFDTGGYNLRKVIIENIDNIKQVVISHLHFDHCSNLDLFINKNIPIYISKKELNYYYKNKDKDFDLFSYFNDIRNNLNIIEVDSCYKIDDDIEIILTPGHTPGHMSLSIKEGKNNILIAGDCIKTYNDYKNEYEFGNAVNSNEYINTKNKLINQYNIIFPGHDSVIKNGLNEYNDELVRF